MPSCPNGARPNAAGQDAQIWVDRASLALEVAGLLQRSAPLFFVSIAAQLHDINTVCAENLDPPEPFTALDLVQLAATVPVFGTLGNTAAAQKAYQWMRYSQFLTYCECIPPTQTPGANCHAETTVSLAAPFNSIAGPWPITIDQDVLDSWRVHPDGGWDLHWSARGTVSGGATLANDVRIEFLLDGVWREIDDFQDLMTGLADVCQQVTLSSSIPRLGTSSSVRIVNKTGQAQTVSNFNFCFCPVASVPKPLPPQDPLVDVPSAPVQICTDIDLCMVIQQIQRSLLNLAAQVSDIQATVSGRDQLVVLSQTPISGEGELPLVLGTRAVSVELTALGPDAFTSALGRPRGLMRVGSVRYGDGVGYSFRRFIDADRFDDPVPDGALSLSWQLLPGTTGILKFLG